MLPIFQLVVLCFLILAIFKNSFKNGKFTCKNFLLNAYLYIFLSFLSISILIDTYIHFKVPSIIEIFKTRGFVYFLLILIPSLVLLMGTMAISPEQVLMKHTAWLAYISFTAYILYPLAKYAPRIFTESKLITFVIMTILTAATFMFPQYIKLSWASALMTALLGLIVMRLIGMFIPFSSTMHYWLSYIGLLLFSIFMLYDTKKLIVKAKQCIKADYVNDSMGVFLDGLNIFLDVFSLRSR